MPRLTMMLSQSKLDYTPHTPQGQNFDVLIPGTAS
jgi:hypothetical protein